MLSSVKVDVEVVHVVVDLDSATVAGITITCLNIWGVAINATIATTGITAIADVLHDDTCIFFDQR